MERKRDRYEYRFFDRWPANRELADSDLTEQYLRILTKSTEKRLKNDTIQDFFGDLEGMSSDWGLDFLNSQFIAELYSESGGEEALILESEEAFQELQRLLTESTKNPTPETVRMLRVFVAERRISTFVRDVFRVHCLSKWGASTT